MGKVVVILLVALVFEAVGVVFLSAGLKQIGEVKSFNASEIGRIVRRGATNPKILAGILLETIFFVFLLGLLKANDVSLIWPLTSLGFVLTALSARFILHEQITPARWLGVALIVIGAALVSWSEKAKPVSQPAAASTKPADPNSPPN
jgi:drug/metabolite transporter (DMT)-like permease